MKKCKRIFSVVMCLALLAGIVTTAPFTANAVGLNGADVAAASADSTGAGTPVGEKKTYGIFEYYHTDDNAIIITGTTTYSPNDIIIPETIDGLPVKYLGENSKYYSVTIGRLEIPSTVVDIASNAFNTLKVREPLVLPENVTLHHDSFSCCTFSAVYLPLGLRHVPDANLGGFNGGAFSNSKIQAVYFADGTTEVPDRLLTNADVKQVDLPSSVTRIGRYAFMGTAKLTNIALPENVTLCRGAFSGSGLTEITLPKGARFEEPEPDSYNQGIFSDCHDLESITIEDGVEEIVPEMFRNCWNKKLTLVEFPPSVTRVAKDAFASAMYINSVSFYSPTTVIEDYAFGYTDIKVVYGFTGSTAQAFADSRSRRTFVSIDSYEPPEKKLPAVNKIPIKPYNNSDFELKLEESLELSIPSDIPIIGGNNIELDLSMIPISASYDGEKIRAGVGLDLTEEDFDPKEWMNIKKWVGDLKEDFLEDLDEGTTLYNKVIRDGGRVSAPADIGTPFTAWGYVEIGLSEGKPVSCSGVVNLQIGVEAEKEWQMFVAQVPVVIKLWGEVGVETEVQLGVDWEKKELLLGSEISLTLPKIGASAGIGVAGIADLSVYGELENTLKLICNLEERRFKGILSGELGISYTVFFFNDRIPIIAIEGDDDEEDGWVYYDSAKQKAGSGVSANELFNAVASEDAFSIDRSYLGKPSQWNGSGEVLSENVYNGALPKLVTAGDVTMLVWTGDIASRTTGNHTAVVYSLLNKSTGRWSEPVMIDDDGTADSDPDVATDGTDIYVTWVNAKKTFAAQPSLSEYAANTEINIAKFDPQAGAFGNSVSVTDNSTLDYKPSVAVKDGKAVVAWLGNSANSIFAVSGKNTVYTATVSATGSVSKKTYYSTDYPIYDVKTNGDQVAFTADLDKNLDTVGDIEVFAGTASGSPEQLTHNSVMESAVQFNTINGKSCLTFVRGGVIYGSEDLKTASALLHTGTSSTDDYRFVSNGDSTKLISVQYKNGKSRIFSYSYENGGWERPVELAASDRYFRGISGTLADGKLQVAYLSTDAAIGKDSLQESSSLCVSVLEEKHNLTLEAVGLSNDEAAPNEKTTLRLQVKNNGSLDESGVKVQIKDEKGSTYSVVTVDEPIKSGEEKTISVDFTVPSSVAAVVAYSVTVTPVGANDADMTDNQKEFTFGYTNLQMYSVFYQNSAGVAVNNDSSYDTPAILQVRDTDANGEVLATYSLGNIKANTTRYFMIDTDELAKLRQKTSFVYVEAVPLCAEKIKSDNFDSFSISAFAPYKIGDANGDDVIDIRDVTTVQRYLAHAQELTGDRLTAADADKDGKVTIADATLIQRYLAEYVNNLYTK